MVQLSPQPTLVLSRLKCRVSELEKDAETLTSRQERARQQLQALSQVGIHLDGEIMQAYTCVNIIMKHECTALSAEHHSTNPQEKQKLGEALASCKDARALESKQHKSELARLREAVTTMHAPCCCALTKAQSSIMRPWDAGSAMAALLMTMLLLQVAAAQREAARTSRVLESRSEEVQSVLQRCATSEEQLKVGRAYLHCWCQRTDVPAVHPLPERVTRSRHVVATQRRGYSKTWMCRICVLMQASCMDLDQRLQAKEEDLKSLQAKSQSLIQLVDAIEGRHLCRQNDVFVKLHGALSHPAKTDAPHMDSRGGVCGGMQRSRLLLEFCRRRYVLIECSGDWSEGPRRFLQSEPISMCNVPAGEVSAVKASLRALQGDISGYNVQGTACACNQSISTPATVSNVVNGCLHGIDMALEGD